MEEMHTQLTKLLLANKVLDQQLPFILKCKAQSVNEEIHPQLTKLLLTTKVLDQQLMMPLSAVPKLEFKLNKIALLEIWFTYFDEKVEQFNSEVYQYLIHGDNGLKVKLADVPSTILSQNIQLEFAIACNCYFDRLFRENCEESTFDVLNLPPGQITQEALAKLRPHVDFMKAKPDTKVAFACFMKDFFSPNVDHDFSRLQFLFKNPHLAAIAHFLQCGYSEAEAIEAVRAADEDFAFSVTPVQIGVYLKRLFLIGRDLREQNGIDMP